MVTSEKIKIKEEKGGVENDGFERKSKVKKEKEQDEKTAQVISTNVFFKNTPNIEIVDSILKSKNAISTSMKAVSKAKKSKTLIKKKPEEITGTEQEKPEAEKLEAKLEADNKVEKAEEHRKEKDGEDAVAVETGKSVEDKEVKPKKKTAGKKVSKKASQKPKAEEEKEKTGDDDTKQITDEVREEKHAEEKNMNGFKDEEVKEEQSNTDIDVTIDIPAIPASKMLEPEDIVATIPVLQTDEIPITRRMHKRLGGFAVLPEQEILALRNDTVKIECEVLNEDDKINWRINGKSVMDDIRCTEVVDGYLRILQIENVVPEDTGTIITANLHEHSVESRLIIEDIPVEIIKKLPYKITGKLDDLIKLSTTVSHMAENCQWFFNNEQLIKNNDHYEVNIEGNICNLLIKNLTYDQAGRYSMKIDSAETSTTLIVEGAPVLHEIETSATMINLESQDNLILTIPFKAIPEPILECFLNNEKIPTSSKMQLDIFNDKVCFRKRKVDKSDAGEYTIKIKNDFGEVSQTFSVNIK
ncbi:unnamed protein product, partial [Brugia timori]|uniref:Ig-like domain-containing protein n=1 Tax=Brugia timori TaxID=42155 RepID=A0A0R3QD12_9BILA